MTLGGISKMSQFAAELVSSKIAELAFSAIKAGVPLLEIPKFVENALQSDFCFSDFEMKEAVKIIFSNNGIEKTKLM
jgi:hypothetical protein